MSSGGFMGDYSVAWIFKLWDMKKNKIIYT